MFMRKIIIKIFFACILQFNTVHALSLEDAIIESLANNLNLKLENSNLEIAEEDVFQSKASFLPTISLTGSISETETSNIISQSGISSSDYELSPSSKSIILSQTLFNGFGRTYNLESSKAEYELQKLNILKTKQDVILETIEAYFSTLITEKSLRSYKDNLKTVSERFESTKKEFEVGLASKTDVAQSESYMNTAKIDFLNAKIKYKNIKNSFQDLVGTEAANLLFSNINSILPESYEEFRDLVMKNNLSILMARTNLNIKTSNVNSAKSAYYPKVDLTASKSELKEYTSLIDTLSTEELKATISWPIFNSGKSLSTVRQAEKMKNSYFILLQKTQQDTLTLASDIWEKYIIGKDTILAADLSYIASKTAFEGTKIEQEVGERTVLDVLNARQSVLNAEIQFFNEQKNQEVIKAQVMYLAGILNLNNIGGI